MGRFGELSGSASWLAILGASFFWAWMDQAMFGSALYGAVCTAEGSRVLSPSQESLAFLLMLAASIAALAAWLPLSSRMLRSLWMPKFVMVCAVAGFAGNAAVVAAGFLGSPWLVYGGVVVSGAAMAALNVGWGKIAVAEGPRKALTHISGAWAMGLLFNLLIAALAPLAKGVVIACFPLAAGGLYLADGRLQRVAPYRIEEAGQGAPQGAAGSSSARPAGGVDARFPLVILVFCVAFGLMCSFEVFPSASSASASVLDVVGLRGLTSLVFFVASLTPLVRHAESLFTACFSFMAVGLLVMTVGLYGSDVQGLTRLFIPVGYAGFDILVWVLVAYYGTMGAASGGRIIAIALLAEQVGIFAGQVAGMASGQLASAFNGLPLILLNYLLLLAVVALVRIAGRALKSMARGEGAAPTGGGAGGSDASEEGSAPQAPLLRFSDAYGLTAREREVLALFAEGRSAPYIAKKLVVSENTVKSHMRHIYGKCDLHNRQELLDAIAEFKEQA